ncbi:hypothetical protein AAG747_16300 [Rapidithrix thailandica]|uniref:Uncharacterized protein n=1 Tax=Rapidithrix thailandica TaxID=413964 RepID=A0AAW9SFJ0_9BACT
MKTIVGLACFLVVAFTSLTVLRTVENGDIWQGPVSIVFVLLFFILSAKWLLSFRPKETNTETVDLGELVSSQVGRLHGSNFVGKVVQNGKQKGTYLFLDSPGNSQPSRISHHRS